MKWTGLKFYSLCIFEPSAATLFGQRYRKVFFSENANILAVGLDVIGTNLEQSVIKIIIFAPKKQTSKKIIKTFLRFDLKNGLVSTTTLENIKLFRSNYLVMGFEKSTCLCLYLFIKQNVVLKKNPPCTRLKKHKPCGTCGSTRVRPECKCTYYQENIRFGKKEKENTG